MKNIIFLFLVAMLVACAPSKSGEIVRLQVDCTTCNYDISIQGSGTVEHKTGTLSGIDHVDVERYSAADECISVNYVTTGATDSLKFWLIDMRSQDTLTSFTGIGSGDGGGYCFQ